MNIQAWARQLLSGKATQSSPTQMGIIEQRGALKFCSPDVPLPGVKLVTVTADFVARYNRITAEYGALQREMSELPVSLRPRKKKAAAGVSL